MGGRGKRNARIRVATAQSPPATAKPAANPDHEMTAPRVAAETVNPP